MSRKNLIITIILILVAVSTAVFFVFKDFTLQNKPTLGEEITLPLSPPPLTREGDGGRVNSADSSLMQLKEKALDRKIPAGPEAAAKELKDLSLELSREPNYLQGWLQIGILRKYLGDYEGASLAWQYASLIRPNDFIAFSNLGDLYHYYLKDFPKAEKYLRRAVDLKPDYVAGYKNLFDLYTLSYKEKANLAEPVLLEGIKKNPNDHYLVTILASYKNDNQR